MYRCANEPSHETIKTIPGVSVAGGFDGIFIPGSIEVLPSQDIFLDYNSL